MRVLLDAAHGADVWMLGAVEDCLVAEGAETMWISRPGKDPVDELIEARGRPYAVGPTAGTDRRSLARELLQRDLLAWRTARDFDPDVILTRSPAGVHAGRLTRTPVLYDTDDGHVVGLLYYLAGPFANLITSPTANTKSYGSRHRKYKGYKELFYLHPSRFVPDPAIRGELGSDDQERLFVLRLSALNASHDFGETGLAREQIDRILDRLNAVGKVVISSQKQLPPDLRVMQLHTPPQRYHHVLATADLVVGDSQTTCAEAAVLGTPSLRYNSWAKRLPYQRELQERWQLTKGFDLSEEQPFFAELDRVLGNLDGERKKHSQRRQQMLDSCQDPVDNLVAWTYELGRR
ncbi:MAG: hypothetical protein KTU85_07385 [Acidimicrobiia bacterium]|nr:hypothetical protein [Acidimicrobiia bacterium]MCY4458027.1 hypothetical protein [Acidimicrobiaceae bacterium]